MKKEGREDRLLEMVFSCNKCGVGVLSANCWKLGKNVIQVYASGAFVFCSRTMTIILLNCTIISILTEFTLY